MNYQTIKIHKNTTQASLRPYETAFINQGHFMRRIFTFILLITLTGCDVTNNLKEGIAQSQLIAQRLEESTGIKPLVTVNWTNGALSYVNLTFHKIPYEISLPDISKLAKGAIEKEFKQIPEQIVISFVINPTDS
ncbi:hypothetical protein [Pseudomonas sp. OTU750018]|uniref:hypothetical protein n=1 Tax=Pseudomonas sp. OTU750018 TaxID=2709708 RepID=UPI001421CBD9|nr:hypothetical protein [Pseudomonas sp. OTU750018]